MRMTSETTEQLEELVEEHKRLKDQVKEMQHTIDALHAQAMQMKINAERKQKRINEIETGLERFSNGGDLIKANLYIEDHSFDDYEQCFPSEH